MRFLRMLARGFPRVLRFLGLVFERAFALGISTFLAIVALGGSVKAAKTLWLNPAPVASDLFVFAACSFIVPIAGTVWWLFFPGLFRGRRGERVASLRVRRSGAIVRLRLRAAPPLVVAAGCFSPLSFAWVWLCAGPLGAKGSVWIAGGIWALMFAACAAMGIVRWRSLRDGKWDLVIDHDARTITLPRAWRRKAPATFEFSSIRHIAVEREMR